MTDPAPVTLAWQLQVDAPLQATWAVFADTDRFNRAAGLRFTFEETPHDDGRVTRRGRLEQFGLSLAWEELPFVFEAPRCHRSERRFDGGPAKRLITTCRLSEQAGGTRVDYEVRIEPSAPCWRPLLLVVAHLAVRRDLGRALEGARAAAEGRAHPYDPPPPPLAAEARERVRTGTDAVVPERLRDHLIEQIATAPLRDQQRMTPLRAAARLDLDPDAAITGFLQAVRDGALQLRWQLLCPSCLGPKGEQASLGGGHLEVHCPSCNIAYDGSFPDALAAVFRPHPEVRPVGEPPRCLLGPRNTPHVLARDRLPAGDEVTWRLDLSPGGYRLLTDPILGTASLEVREGLQARRITVDVTEHGIRPPLLRAGPGPIDIAIRSRVDDPLHVHLQREWRPPWTLTAGRLLESAAARHLLPDEALVEGLHVRLGQGVVLAARVQGGAGSRGPARQTLDFLLAPAEAAGDPLAWLGEAVQSFGPSVLREGNSGLLAVFDTPERALGAAERLAGEPGVSAALTAGEVIRLEGSQGTLPLGRAVDEALAILRATGGGRVALAGSARDLRAALRGMGERARLHAIPGQGHDLVDFRAARERRAERLHRREPATAPSRVGRFEVGEPLGRGGSATVYAARDPESGDDVVLKLLHPALRADPDSTQRFYNEARLTSTLEHPNVVRVFEWGAGPNGDLYIVMERLPGHALSEETGLAPLELDRARAIARGVLEGLSAAHARGIVHRDVKPSNLVVLDDGDGPPRVKVIDFGLARPFDTPDASGHIVGTPAYMSPEQVRGAPLDGRSDLYAVGVVLYEALTGALPFEDPDPHGLARRRLDHDPAPVDSHRDLPDHVARAVMRALERSPAARPPDATAMRDALDDPSG